MYIDNLSDEQLCGFVEDDMKRSEGEIAWRGDGFALDLMADLFAGDHSRDDKHYLYEIKQIKRKANCIEVKGYSIRVRCPGNYRSGSGDVCRGNFSYVFTDLEMDKKGNVSWGGYQRKIYIKFVYDNLPPDQKVEYKKLYLESVGKEAESFLDC